MTDKKTGNVADKHPSSVSDSAGALKPCPFCGGPGRVSNRRNGDLMQARWCVFCKGPVECGAEMGFYDTKAEAVSAWNRRAT